MPLPVVATTELEAVNTMLTTIGESPVNTISESTADTRIAYIILGEVNRATQIRGWHWNTESDVTLTPDGTTKEITLGTDIVRVDVDERRYSNVNVIQRGTKLYDKKNHTYQFSEPLKAEVVYLRTFAEMPEQARYYIIVRSARLFQQRMIGDATGSAFSSEEETTALLALQNAEDETADYNILDQYDIGKVTSRRPSIV
jgi:hypothetical protein